MKSARQVINDFVIKFLEGSKHYRKEGFYDVKHEEVVRLLKNSDDKKDTLSWVLDEFLIDDFHEMGISLEDKWDDDTDSDDIRIVVYKIGKKFIMTKYSPMNLPCEYHFVKPKKRKVVVIDYEVVT